MAPTTLVSTAELARSLERGAGWRIFDCRHELAQPALGGRQYAEAHLPGALFAHLDRDLSAPKSGSSGRHPLPEPGRFAAWLGMQGLRASDPVVCYDAGGGAMAARLWWLLRWIGHPAAAVLDGGYARWIAEGRPVTKEAPAFPATQYPLAAHPELALDVGTVERERARLVLLDARAPARFRGEQEPIDPVAGRIPGARNRFCNDNLAADGRFKDAGTLKAEFGALLGGRAPGEVVHYCGSGVAACHNALAMEIAGLPGSRLYPGSWSEWIADPRRPRETG
jgi:thiosulfate/3-mercaptopyruvate sulfurtransferase